MTMYWKFAKIKYLSISTQAKLRLEVSLPLNLGSETLAALPEGVHAYRHFNTYSRLLLFRSFPITIFCFTFNVTFCLECSRDCGEIQQARDEPFVDEVAGDSPNERIVYSAAPIRVSNINRACVAKFCPKDGPFTSEIQTPLMSQQANHQECV